MVETCSLSPESTPIWRVSKNAQGEIHYVEPLRSAIPVAVPIEGWTISSGHVLAQLTAKAFFCVMQNLLAVFLFLMLGLILQHWRRLPKGAATYLNRYLIYAVLPALALLYIPRVEPDVQLAWPIAAAWISFGLAWLFFGLVGKWRGWSRGVTGCLIITCGLANTSFVGFPVVHALYGSEGIKIALLIDQAGSFVLVGSMALVVAAIYSEGHKRKRDITRSVLTFPPFFFFVVAVVLNVAGVAITGFPEKGLGLIAATLTPVALTAVGLQIKVERAALRNRYLWLGLCYKLVGIPLVIFLLFRYVLGLEGLLVQVSVVEMAMAPMITGSIIAIAHHLEPRLASLLVGVGIPLSLLTLAGWYLVLLQL